MQRKLIQQGPGSLTLYLPKKWVENHKLSKGDEVDMEEIEGKLIINTLPGKKRKNETTIRLIGLDESLIRILIANTYRLGYEKITVEFENERQFHILQEIISKRLIGFEIVKKDNNKCIVENVTEPSDEQFDNILSKLFLNVESLFEETLKEFLHEKDMGEDIEDIEDRIIKYDNFCRRIILKQRFDVKSNLKWHFLLMIVHAQRELYYASKKSNKNIKYSKELINLISESKEMFKLIKETYEKKDISNIAEINKKEKTLLYEKGYSILENKKGKEIIATYHILAAIRNLYQSISPLSALLI